MAVEKTVLIADDSASLRSVVRLKLEQAGYRVLEAADGREALRELEGNTKVHLIISDVNMPHLDGIALVRKLKEHPRHRFIPVIMLTTENQSATKEQGRAAGARAWVVKPFNGTQLVDAVAKLVLPN